MRTAHFMEFVGIILMGIAIGLLSLESFVSSPPTSSAIFAEELYSAQNYLQTSTTVNLFARIEISLPLLVLGIVVIEISGKKVKKLAIGSATAE